MPFSINQLAKPILRTYIPPRLAQPGFPGRPYSPARWVTLRRRICQWTNFSVASTEGGSGLSLGGGAGFTLAAGNQQPTQVCRWESYQIFQPEMPAIPPRPPSPAVAEQTIIDFQLGWNARAHSVVPMEGAGTFQFRVPRSTTGAVVGITPAPRDVGYSDIRYGFYVASGVVRIYESGQEVASLGANPDALLSITRYGGRIIYRVGSTVVRDIPNFSGPAYLSAGLYTGGDSVDDAELLDVAAAYGSFEAMQGYAGENPPSQAIGSMLPMTGECGSYATGGATGSFPVMTGAAADASGYAFASGSFLPMTGFAESADLVPDYAVADGFMMPMTGAAQGIMHIVGTAEGAFPAMIGLASEGVYSQAVGSFLPMQGYADATEGVDEATIFSGMFAQDNVQPQSVMFALIDADMNLSGVFTLSSVATANILAELDLSDDYDLAAQLSAVIASWMEASAQAFDTAQAAARDVWVYHMDSAGSTRYSGYDFTGFAKVSDAYYGLKPDGIYRLEGEDDDGEVTPASVNFGSLNFGTINRKALPYVYVGMASNGDTFMRVTADGNTYTYRVRHSTEMMKAHRYELGRGLEASFYDLELVADGTVFDLESIDFQAIALKRRL